MKNHIKIFTTFVLFTLTSSMAWAGGTTSCTFSIDEDGGVCRCVSPGPGYAPITTFHSVSSHPPTGKYQCQQIQDATNKQPDPGIVTDAGPVHPG
jgi:hypothetical protein